MGPDLTANDGGGPKVAVNSSSSNSQAFLGNKPNDLPDPNAEHKHIDTSQERALSTQSAVENKQGSIAFEILALVCFLERNNVIVFKFYCVHLGCNRFNSLRCLLGLTTNCRNLKRRLEDNAILLLL